FIGDCVPRLFPRPYLEDISHVYYHQCSDLVQPIHHKAGDTMFKPEGPAQRAEVYGTYRSSWGGIVELVRIVWKIITCKAYCWKHGYHVSFTVFAFEDEEADHQGDSMEFRHLIRRIEQESIEMVLLIDVDWIRKKPQQVERLLNVAEEHHTTLI